MNRRDILKIFGAGLALTVVPSIIFFKKSFNKISYLLNLSPIDRKPTKDQYSGDNPTKAHAALWDKEGFLKRKGIKELTPQEKTKLVIIGGGISGLSSALLLKDFEPIILEQANRFGGNSKGESWEGIDYSIGAAYFTKPSKDSDIDLFFKEIGANNYWKEKVEEDPVVIDGRIFKNFWNGESSSKKEQFKKLKDYFLSVYNEETNPYPEMPIRNENNRDQIEALNSISFLQHCETIIGEKLDPKIRAVLEHYCWSSLGAGMNEISAAHGLNFYAAEFGPLMIMPGGNSKIVELILKKLIDLLPVSNLRTDSLVFEVKNTKDGVLVSYDQKGEIKTILAEKVIMSCPKFVVKNILVDIEDERKKAIDQIKYTSYLVANVCINKSIPNNFYDLYLAGNIENTDFNKIKENSLEQKVTDVVYGNFSNPNKDRTVITLYRPLPFLGARGMILSPESYQNIKKEFKDQIEKEIISLLGIEMSDIAEIRIARWGHPLPVGNIGMIKNKSVDQLRKPFKDNIFFIEQDNWALPALETSLTEALLICPIIKKALS